MSTEEQILQQDIRAELGEYADIRMFRNNVGKAIPVGRGHKRPVDYGLCRGASDLIGIKAVEITQEMVGKTIGQFVAAEVKTPTGRVTEIQYTFLRVVAEMGGKAVILRSIEDAKELVE